jgi:hypothetical protein
MPHRFHPVSHPLPSQSAATPGPARAHMEEQHVSNDPYPATE